MDAFAGMFVGLFGAVLCILIAIGSEISEITKQLKRLNDYNERNR